MWGRKKEPDPPPPERDRPFLEHRDDATQVDPRKSRRRMKWSKNSKQVKPRDPDGGSAYNE